MPTYIYVCTKCGHEFEHFEKMTSATRTRKCPACGGRGERQISGGAGFLFKGEGFYSTDYRSAEYRSKAKAETAKAEDKKAPGEGDKKRAAGKEKKPRGSADSKQDS